MSTLVVTGNDSSAGCLKMARRSVNTLGLWPRLLVGPPPDDATVLRIFGSQDSAFDDAFESRRGPIMGRYGRRSPGSPDGLKPLCKAFDHVEFWFDPDAESQLALALVLHHLRDDPEALSKIVLVHPDQYISELTPEAASLLEPPREPVSDVHLVLASGVWNAWRFPTPEPMCDLLAQDLSAFPFLRLNVDRILCELPASDSGLAASELVMLNIVAEGGATGHSVLSRYHQERWPGTYTGFDAGQVLDDLANADEPAILGLPAGPCDMALMGDTARYGLYAGAPLRLSDCGERLLAGTADFAEAKPRARWWGATELTSERPWRWDAGGRTLKTLG